MIIPIEIAIGKSGAFNPISSGFILPWSIRAPTYIEITNNNNAEIRDPLIIPNVIASMDGTTPILYKNIKKKITTKVLTKNHNIVFIFDSFMVFNIILLQEHFYKDRYISIVLKFLINFTTLSFSVISKMNFLS
jgi:hypothetical protein